MMMNDECIQEEGLITMSMGLACEVVGCEVVGCEVVGCEVVGCGG